MKRSGYITLTAFLLISCAQTSAILLGNDMAQIDISGNAFYTRAGVQGEAIKKAAKTTLQYKYDKFIVLGDKGWNEQTAAAINSSSFSAGGNRNMFSAAGQSFGSSGTFNKPESSMVIRMFHYNDKGADKAIDAHQMFPTRADPSYQGE